MCFERSQHQLFVYNISCWDLQQLKLRDICNIPWALSSSHHYSTNKADTSATISIRYNVTIAYTQKGDSDKPKAVEYVSKFLIMIPEELYNIYQQFPKKQIIEPWKMLNVYTSFTVNPWFLYPKPTTLWTFLRSYYQYAWKDSESVEKNISNLFLFFFINKTKSKNCGHGPKIKLLMSVLVK